MKLPEIGDKVVYHPRPSDRVRKPDFYAGLVSHTATVAHINENGGYNLGVLDSGGYPYAVQDVVFVVEGGKHPEYGGWLEWQLDKELNKVEKDPFIKDPNA